MTEHRRTETDRGISRRRLLASAAVTTAGLAAGAGTVATARGATSADAVSGIAGAPPAGASRRPFAPWSSSQLYDTAFYRLVGEGAAGGCDFEELFFAAQRIGPRPTRETWTRELAALGRGLIADARGLTAHDPLLARATALRGQNYLRSAEYFIVPQGPTLARKVAMFREVRAGFALAALGESARPQVKPVRVPYEGKRLYAYLVEPMRRRGARVPAILFYGGIDTIGEQLLLKAALRFAERGWATLILDGPGMGATLRFIGLPGRYDYEHVAKAAFDWLDRVSWIDSRRIAIVGESLGGYYAIRSAAFEHRARACVNWGGVYNLVSSGAAGGHGDKESTDALISQALWVIGGNSQRRFAQQLPKFNLAGVPRNVRCPTLHIYGADDDLVPMSDAHRLYAEVPAHKTFHLVPSGYARRDALPVGFPPGRMGPHVALAQQTSRLDPDPRACAMSSATTTVAAQRYDRIPKCRARIVVSGKAGRQRRRPCRKRERPA